MKVTQWFPWWVSPARVGAYEIKVHDSSPPFHVKYAWWSGIAWSVPHYTPDGAMGAAGFDTPIQCREWRGLANKP